MTLSSEIFDYLDTLSPAALALDWDNSGLQVGSRNAPVRKILVALDPFEDVCREAVAMGAELVITHHPLFFNPIKSLTDESAVSRAAVILIQNGIGLFSCHTNLDIAPGGVNDCLARALGLENPTVFGSEQLLRKGQIPEQPLEQFLEAVKSKLGCPGLRYVSAGKPCRSIAVGGGACADFLAEVAAAAGKAEAQPGHRHQGHAVRRGNGLADDRVTADHLPHLAHGGLHHFAEVGLFLVFHIVHPFQTAFLYRFPP